MHFSNEQWQQCIFSGIIYFSYLSSISIFQYSSKMLHLLRFPLFIKICQNPSISRRIYPTLRSRRQWGWMLYYDICIEESYSLSFILRHDCTKHRGFAPFLSWKEMILNSLPTLEADSPFWMVCGREERESVVHFSVCLTEHSASYISSPNYTDMPWKDGAGGRKGGMEEKETGVKCSTGTGKTIKTGIVSWQS